MKKKSISCVMILSLLATLISGCTAKSTKETSPKKETYQTVMTKLQENTTSEKLTCWYTNEEDKDWLKNLSKQFKKEYGKDVDFVYYDGVSFFEDMNQANQKGEGPDVYLCENDQLELARNSGLAEENTEFTKSIWEKNYPEVAKNAVTFKNKTYGYPVYFDTYCLVYDSQIIEKAPASMEDILVFADEYSDTGSTKAILRWDVADPYINTLFLAEYADLFGANGDDSSAFQIYNEKTIEAMEYFNSISEYMWMNKGNISHDIVKSRIQEGTLVLGLCKSDILSVLDEANKQDVNYKISYMPSLTKELASKPYSTTYIAMVNPYSKDDSLANLFAAYISIGHPELQYPGNGKLPVIDQKDSFDENQKVLYGQYINSTPVPKVMIFGDYLSESAITYDEIWAGKDVDKQLSKLQEIMDEKIK